MRTRAGADARALPFVGRRYSAHLQSRAPPPHHPEFRRPCRRAHAGNDSRHRHRRRYRKSLSGLSCMPSAPLLDREFLEKLERLTIHWQKSFAGLVGGHNKSRFPGAGQEFLDHRNFHHGDDLRAVNWRAYMRLEKLFLKMFQVEPRVPVRMLVDTSASMMAHGGAKFDYARKLAGALCY